MSSDSMVIVCGVKHVRLRCGSVMVAVVVVGKWWIFACCIRIQNGIQLLHVCTLQ